jgi:hypothetical protein
MAERRLVILKFAGRIPTLAGCSECSRKFFTPANFGYDQLRAEHYLSEKFDQHTCMSRRTGA